MLRTCGAELRSWPFTDPIGQTLEASYPRRLEATHRDNDAMTSVLKFVYLELQVPNLQGRHPGV